MMRLLSVGEEFLQDGRHARVFGFPRQAAPESVVADQLDGAARQRVTLPVDTRLAARRRVLPP